MMERQKFILINSNVRDRAIWALKGAPDGYHVEIRPPTRSLEQNAFLHSLISDVAKSGFKWAGKERDADTWKTLFISAHAVATKESGHNLAGLEGELVFLRESTARMTKSRSSSLIEYILAFCASNGIKVTDGEAYRYERH